MWRHKEGIITKERLRRKVRRPFHVGQVHSLKEVVCNYLDSETKRYERSVQYTFRIDHTYMFNLKLEFNNSVLDR
jgi:hypothetical protein